MTVVGIAVDGSLNLLHSNPTLASYDVAANMPNVRALEYSADRTETQAATSTYSYYIMVDADINSYVYHNPSGNGIEDDSWGLNAMTFNSSDSGLVYKYNLPSQTGIDVEAGIINAYTETYDGTQTTIGDDYKIILTIGVDASGVLNASAEITGAQTLTGSVAEDLLRAQIVQWEINGETPPSVDSNTQDILETELTLADLNTHYQAQLDALANTYNSSVVSSWNISINAIPATNNSSLSQHARFRKATDKKVFVRDEKIVASSSSTYCLSISDYQGVARYIVPDCSVYGVVKQTNAGASDEQA